MLGALFRSRDFQNNETELVVMVSAYLVNPGPPTADRAPRRRLCRSDRSETILLGRLNTVYDKDGEVRPTPPRAPSALSCNEERDCHDSLETILRGSAVLAALLLRPARSPISTARRMGRLSTNSVYPITVEPHMSRLSCPYRRPRAEPSTKRAAPSCSASSRDYLRTRQRHHFDLRAPGACPMQPQFRLVGTSGRDGRTARPHHAGHRR